MRTDWRQVAAQYEVRAEERDRAIERLNQRIRELEQLVDDISKPVMARHGWGPAGTSIISGRSPRTRWSVAGAALLVFIAVVTILIIAPWVSKVPQKPGEASTAGLCTPMRTLANTLSARYGLVITSTTGGRHAPGSYHYRGMAADLAGNANAMFNASRFLMTSGRYRGLVEGIHNPNLSVKYGQRVPYTFWGVGTWANHANHLHLAGCGAALAVGADHGDRLPLSVARRSHGHNVCVLQRRLNRIRRHVRGRKPLYLRVDCRYGQRTRVRVHVFQRNRRLAHDGVVGRRTWRAVRRAAR